MRTPFVLPVIVILLTLALGAVAQADPVVQLVGSVDQDSLGLWTYNYEIINVGGSADIWDFFLTTSVDSAEIANTPADWVSFYFPAGGGAGVAVDWTTPDWFAETPVSNPVTAGHNSFELFGRYFTLKSPYPVGANAAQYAFNGDLTPSGNVDGPANANPTPEPVTLALLAASGIGALTVRRRRR